MCRNLPERGSIQQIRFDIRFKVCCSAVTLMHRLLEFEGCFNFFVNSFIYFSLCMCGFNQVFVCVMCVFFRQMEVAGVTDTTS